MSSAILCSSRRVKRETSSVPSSGYNVAALAAALPGSWALPTAPSISSSQTVSTEAALNANIVAGRQVTMDPNATWNLTNLININVSDFSLIATGCTITGSSEARQLLISSGSRIKVTGGTWSKLYEIDGISGSDVHIYDAKFQNTESTGGGAYQVYGNWQRVLIEKTIHRIISPNNGMCMFSGTTNLFGFEGIAPSNLIIANSLFKSNGGAQANLRFQGGKALVMDCYSENVSHHTLRAHDTDGSGTAPMSYMVVARNLHQGGRVQFFGGAGNPLQIQNLHLLNNQWHTNMTGYFINAADITTATITNTTVYDDGGSPWQTGVAGWSYTGSSQVGYTATSESAWNGTGLPQP